MTKTKVTEQLTYKDIVLFILMLPIYAILMYGIALLFIDILELFRLSIR